MSDLKKILHAEDDPDIREIAMMSLEMLGGFELLQCGNGQEAVSQAKLFAPDMFLMDVMMPVMGGVDAVNELRRLPEFEQTPVIFVTAKASDGEVENLKKIHKADVITKPFDPTTLPEEIVCIWKRLSA